MAFRDSINDLMYRFYERFKQNNNRLPVSVDADINVGDVQIGTVKQGAKDAEAEPWDVALQGMDDPEDPVGGTLLGRLSALEEKMGALLSDGLQLKGHDENPVNVQLKGSNKTIPVSVQGQVLLDPVSAGVVVAGTELQRLPGRQRGTVMIRGVNNDMPKGSVYLMATRSPLRVVDLNIWASTGQVAAFIYTLDALGSRLRYEVAQRNSDTGDYSWSDTHRFYDIAGSNPSDLIHSPVFDAEGEAWDKPHRFFLRPERAPLDLPGGLELRVFRNSGGHKLAWSIEIAEGVI